MNYIHFKKGYKMLAKIKDHPRAILISIVMTFLFSTGIFAAGFTDNHNDGVLNGWTRYGTRTWSEWGGAARAQDGSNSTGFLINNYAATDNGTIEVTATADQWNGNRGGVVFRWTSPSSYYYVGVLPGNQWSNGIYFCRNSLDLSSATLVASNFQMGTTFTLKIEIDGSNFTFYINNVYRGQIIDAINSTGKVGYAQTNSWNRYTSFDNIIWTDAEQATFDLTTSVNGSGTVSPPSGTYPNGQAVTITATPDTGWQFDHWSGDASGTTNPITVSMDADKHIIANFTEIPNYDLTTGVDGQGTVSPESGTFQQGTTVQITATAATGWMFDHWSGDASGSTNPITVTMDVDKNIIAHFIQITYDLQVTVDGEGIVTPGSGTYPQGTPVEIIATAATGWVFDHWSGDASGSANPITITMDTDKNVTAHFTQITHDLQVTVDGQGTVNPGSGTYPEGTPVAITATAAEGWIFDHWSGDASGSINPVTVTMDTEKNITAHFTEIPLYSLTTTIDGQGSVNPASGTYPQGTSVEITAMAAAGWVFDHWSGDGTGNLNPLTITMDGDMQITAHFVEAPSFSLTTAVQGQGTVNPPSGSFPEGAQIEITATADEGWVFDHWSGDASGNLNPLQLLMDANKHVVAHFVEQTPEYTLTTSVLGNGSVEPASGTFTAGSTVEITATADDGWVFDHWSGEVSGNQNPLPLLMDADKYVVAHFVEVVVEYELTTTVSGAGSITPANGTFTAGTTVELSAVPESGWQFDHWESDASGADNPYSLLMDADKSVIAVFIETTPTVPNSSKLSLSSRLLNADGTPVGNDLPELRDITARLFDQELGGDLLFTETFLQSNGQGTIVDRGYFAVRLGEGTTADDLQSVLSANNNLWVELTVGDITFPQRIPLTSSPYVIH